MQDNQRAEWILKETDLMKEEERIWRESRETEHDMWQKMPGKHIVSVWYIQEIGLVHSRVYSFYTMLKIIHPIINIKFWYRVRVILIIDWGWGWVVGYDEHETMIRRFFLLVQ